MNPRPLSLLVLGFLSSLGACTQKAGTPARAGEDSAEIDAAGPRWWEEGLEAAPLAAFQPLRIVSLPSAASPTRIQALPARSLVMVQDAPAIWVLDSRYQHDPAPSCISAEAWPDWAPEDRRLGCPEGSVHTQRGALSVPDGDMVALAVDAAGLQAVLLDARGRLWWTDADVLRGNPLDHLRLQPLTLTGEAVTTDALLALSGTTLAIAEDSTLRLLDLDASGQEILRWTLPAPALGVDLLEDGSGKGAVVWTRTALGVLRGTEILPETAAAGDLDLRPDRVAISLPATDQVLLVDAQTGAEVNRLTQTALRGPVAQDPASDRIYALTGAGVTELTTGATLAGDFIDVTVNAAHEVVLLSASGEVQVYGDDLALTEGGRPPVDLMAAAFVERPRSPDTDVPCRGGEETVQAFAAHIQENAVLLADLPVAVATGLTPHFVRRAQACEETAALEALGGLERASVGVLFHQQSDCAPTDLDCTSAFLRAEADVLASVDLEWGFSSGLSTWEGDWVAALVQTGGPLRYLFFGMSILPEIDHEGDPRAKDSWPLAARASAWRLDRVEDVATRPDSGALMVYPGDNLPAFNLGGCPNLLLRECHLTGDGGGAVLDAADGEVLLLLTRRAVAERTAAGVSAWSFHLPDLGVYDYTDDATCSRDDRGWWSGDSCEAVILQAWAATVQTHYVLNGLARWTPPAALEAP